MAVNHDARILAYINDVCSQIKFRDVHQEIELELKNHFHEIIEEYLSQGFSKNEAVSKAVAQMGSAGVVGKQLNKVHNSKPEWSVLTIGLILVSLGLLAMHLIEKQALLSPVPIHIFTRSLVFTVMGAVMTTGLYFFDYRKIEAKSGRIYLGTLLAVVLAIIYGQRVNGESFVSLGSIYINITGICPLLFSVALAGIINSWDWNGPGKLLQGLLLCMAPLVLILASGPLSAGVIYSIACVTILAVSGARPRYTLSLTGMASVIILLSIISGHYGLKRLITLYNPGTPNLHTDFVFSYLTYNFGWISGAVLSALAVIFLMRMSRIAAAVKNNYARLLVSGFTAILAVQFAWNILMNLGIAPVSGVGLPFISFGGSQLIFNASILGLVLSIYRRRNISTTLLGSQKA